MRDEQIKDRLEQLLEEYTLGYRRLSDQQLNLIYCIAEDYGIDPGPAPESTRPRSKE